MTVGSLHATVAFLGVFLAALTSIACQTTQEPAAEGGSRMDTIVFATASDATTLDPAESANNDSDAINLTIYDGLLAFDENMHIVGKLAERWSVDPDGVTWTFHLRRGIRFHDGTPLDATAVKQCFDRLLDPVAAHRNRPLVEMIVRVDAVDAQTVRMITAFPFGSFEPTIANLDTGIVSPTAAAKWGKRYGSSAEAAVGTGPFKVASWKKDVEIVLERNDDYWGEKPRVRRVVYRPVPDVESKVAALEAGDVDVITRIPANAAARLQRNRSIVLLKQPSLNSYLLRFNNRRKPFSDPRVRKAISSAIDRRAIVDNLMTGIATVPTGPLPPMTRNSVRLGEILYAPAEARRLLRQAGYPHGFRTRLTTAARNIMGVELAEALAAQLKHVGIDARLDVIEHAIFMGGPSTQRAADEREMYIHTLASSTGDADWALRPRFKSLSPINQDYYSNLEFDRVIVQAMKETDADKRLALYKRAQQIVYLEDPPVVWLFEIYNVTAARHQVKDLTLRPINTVTFERAYVSAAP